MAKKTASKKRVLKKKVTEAATAPVEAPKKPGVSKAAIGAALAVLTLITAFEIQSVMKIKVRESKTPVVVSHWRLGKESTGLTSMYNYGTSLYMVDGTRGTMLSYDTMTGKYLNKYEVTQGLYSMAALSNGDLLALTTGSSVVRFPEGKVKPLAAKALEGCASVSYIAADSSDNVYAVDSGRNLIVKYDKDLKKLAEYGQGNLTAARKVFVGPQESMYVLDYNKPKKVMVKIFSKTGELKKQFYVLGNSPCSNYEGMAITPEGRLYINNLASSSIMCYAPDGSLLGNFNTTKDNSVSIVSPPGICGGMDGNFEIPASEIIVLQNIAY